MSLGVGAYRTSQGKPWILPVVKKAEKILAEKVSSLMLGSKTNDILGREYAPTHGYAPTRGYAPTCFVS